MDGGTRRTVHRNSGTNRVAFSLLRIPRSGRRAERVELSVHIGAGDDGEPVATIMLPTED